MALKGPVEPAVLVAWIRVLRDHPWPGPIYDWRDLYPVQARNKITEKFLQGPADALLMFDSDQIPPLMCLDGSRTRYMAEILEAITEPVVCGLVYMRDPPYEPTAYEFKHGRRYFLSSDDMARRVRHRSMTQVEAACGSVLIQRRVLEHLQRSKAPREIWEATPEYEMDETWQFCAEVRELGYKIWLDTRWEAGHVEKRIIGSREYFEEHGYAIEPATIPGTSTPVR